MNEIEWLMAIAGAIFGMSISIAISSKNIISAITDIADEKRKTNWIYFFIEKFAKRAKKY